jgi:hypothetical protein
MIFQLAGPERYYSIVKHLIYDKLSIIYFNKLFGFNPYILQRIYYYNATC